MCITRALPVTLDLHLLKLVSAVFMEKSCRKCAPKASPRLLFYFGKQLKKAIVCNKFF